MLYICDSLYLCYLNLQYGNNRRYLKGCCYSLLSLGAVSIRFYKLFGARFSGCSAEGTHFEYLIEMPSANDVDNILIPPD